MWFFENIKNKIIEYPVAFALDIVLTALLIYGIIVFLKKNNAVRLVLYLLPFTLLGIVLSSPKLQMQMSGRILSYSVVFVILAVVLLFPQEAKRGLLKLASPKDTHEAYATEYAVSDDVLRETISEIVRATQNMAKKNVGALIVVTTQDVPAHILESGTKLDSILSGALLESIFITKGPLHDGAVFVRGNRIVAAGCFLPLSQSTTIDKELGTRHRAAIGVTENYNVLTIICSEETGVISTAQHGRINRYYDSQMLTEKLEQVYGLKAVRGGKNRKKEG